MALLLLLLASVAAEADIGDRSWLRRLPADLRELGIDSDELRLDEAAAQRYRNQGHSFVELLVRQEIEVARDGDIHLRVIRARHFLDERGFQEAGNLSYRVATARDELDLRNASVILPDGSVKEIGLGRAQVSTVNETNVFSDFVDVVLPFEGLVEGSTAVLVVDCHLRMADWPLPWSLIIFPVRQAPIHTVSINVRWAKGVPDPVWSENSPGLNCQATGVRAVRCRAEDLPAWELGKEFTRLMDGLPQFVVSERRSWQDIALAERSLVEQSMSRSRGIKSLVGKVIEGAQDDADRLRAIYRFVADEVRYVALVKGLAAVVPAPVEETLHRRYGDCKGKVALFLALAREAGLDAHAVLVATDRTDPGGLLLPSASYFDHLIACVRLPDDKAETCVETTSADLAFGDLPTRLHGAVALSLTKDPTSPRRLPVPRFDWDISLRMKNTLMCDGRLVESLHRGLGGPGVAGLRGHLRALSQEGRKSWVTEDYRSAAGVSQEVKGGVVDLETVDGRFTLESATTYEIGAPESLSSYTEVDNWLQHYADWFQLSEEERAQDQSGVRIHGAFAMILMVAAVAVAW